MSESATFTQPGSPTVGLQRYDLESRVRQLVPGTGATARWARLRRMARNARKRSGQHGDSRMSKIDTDGMVAILSKSVMDIVAADAADRDAQLAKGFGEFKAELGTQLEKLTPDAEEPMFKGLGAVGRICSLVGQIARQVKNIKEGKDWDGQDKTDDPCSAEVGEMLDHLVVVAELSMRCAINEHVDLPDDDFDEEDPQVPAGMHLVAVPMGKDASGADVSGYLFTDIDPKGDAAEILDFVTPADDLAKAFVEAGLGMLMEAGLSEDELEKAFSTGGLAKAAPQPGTADPAGAADPGAGDPGADDAPDPITVAGRLCAALMLQIDHIQTLVQGGDPGDGAPDGTAGDPTGSGSMPNSGDGQAAEGDPNGDPAASVAAPQPSAKGAAADGDPKKKPPFAKMAGADPELQNSFQEAVDAAVAEHAEKEFGPMKAALEKLLAQPAPGGAYAGPAAALTLSKAADTAGAAGLGGAPSDDDLAKMDPTERAVALTKVALHNPRPVVAPRITGA